MYCNYANLILNSKAARGQLWPTGTSGLVPSKQANKAGSSSNRVSPDSGSDQRPGAQGREVHRTGMCLWREGTVFQPQISNAVAARLINTMMASGMLTFASTAPLGTLGKYSLYTGLYTPTSGILSTPLFSICADVILCLSCNSTASRLRRTSREGDRRIWDS